MLDDEDEDTDSKQPEDASPTDSEFNRLIEAARAGDDGLWRLANRMWPKLIAAVQRKLRGLRHPSVNPSDIVQKSVSAASESIQNFRGTTFQEWENWLLKIVHYQTVGEIRYAKRQRRDISAEQVVDNEENLGQLAVELGSSPSGNAVARETIERLKAALQELPDAERDAVCLRYLEEWPMARIAEHLGRTENSVIGLVRRGLLRLHSIMQRDDEG